MGRLRVVSFVRRLAGLREASLESEFYEEFRRLGRDVDLVVITDDVEGGVEGFRAWRVWTLRIPRLYGLSKILGYVYAVWRLRSWADILYVRTFSPPESVALLIGKRMLGLPALLLLPGTWIFEPPTLKNRFWRWVLSKVVGHVDMLVLYSPLMLPEVMRYFDDISLGKVRYILFVGRVSSRKGVDDLVRAFGVAAERVEDVELVVAGSEDHGYGDYVRSIVRVLGLEDRVRFLGPVPNQEIPDLMCGADVFAYASRGGEGIPRAILEAMACGLPVVATRVAGVPEAVREGETGFLVEAGDWRGLGRGLVRLLSDVELRERMGREARRLVEREFSYDVVIPRLVEALREAAGRREIKADAS